MRAVLLISFFICIFLHFKSQNAETSHVDSINVRQSSVKKVSAAKAALPSLAEVASETPIALAQADEDHAQLISEAELEEDEYDDEDLTQLPWDDIEEGWKTHLKEFLTSVDPDKAEDMYSAYMEEKKKYIERVDFSERDSGVAEDLAASTDGPVVENDVKTGELERMHGENLKEIFGDHYSQVESLHKEYVDSVQYLNRSSVKFSISL
jgi:hypothetical protein